GCQEGGPSVVAQRRGLECRECSAPGGGRGLKCDSVDLAFVDEKEALTRGSAADVRHEGDRSIVVHGRRLERRESPAPRSRRTLERDSRDRAFVDEEYPLTRSSAADVRHEGDDPAVVQGDGVERRERPAPWHRRTLKEC